MDWTTIIVNVVTTIGTVIVAWLGLRKTLADLGKTTAAAKEQAEQAASSAGRASGAAIAAAKASHKTEQSINGRDTPASDRWDATHEDVKKALASTTRIEETLERHGKDIKGIRDEIGQLHGADRETWESLSQLRRNFSRHVDGGQG